MFLSDDDDDNHGVRRADTARALARWLRLGASHKATDTLHWVMCLALYQPRSMAVGFVVDYVQFIYFLDNIVANKLIYTPSINQF